MNKKQALKGIEKIQKQNPKLGVISEQTEFKIIFKGIWIEDRYNLVLYKLKEFCDLTGIELKKLGGK